MAGLEPARQGPNTFATDNGPFTLEFDKRVLKTPLPPGDAEILVANTDIPQGTRLTQKMVTRVRAADSLHAVVVTPHDCGLVANQRVRCNVVKGAPLLFGDLDPSTAEVDVERFIEQRSKDAAK